MNELSSLQSYKARLSNQLSAIERRITLLYSYIKKLDKSNALVYKHHKYRYLSEICMLKNTRKEQIAKLKQTKHEFYSLLNAKKSLKILVVGGAGYIGSHVVKELNKHGHKVTVFDNFSTGLKQNLFAQNDYIYGDILKTEDLDDAFSQGFDACIHLAALKSAGNSMNEPEKYSVNNITGTINLLNSALKYNCKYIVFSSSAAIFGEPLQLPINEAHPTNPENYYGFTKLVSEQIMDWYAKLKGLKFAALRYFNAAGYDMEGEVCGLEQNPENLLPVIMEVATGKRDKLQIFGDKYLTRDGTCIRDYVHVTDLANAHVKALNYIISNNECLKVNLGSGKGTSVKELLKTARQITNKAIPAETVDNRPGDPAMLIADSMRAKDLLDWFPKFSNEEALITSSWKAYTNSLKGSKK